MQFIDANVFLRFLTRDDPVKAERVKKLLERAQRGEVALFTSESVITELVFVLSSPRLYNLGREQVRAVLLPVVALKGLKLPGRKAIVDALDLYAVTSMDFVDALAVAQMKAQEITEIYSYDEHFDSVKGVKRLEP
jgi:predicted nucleic acid-binding protein